MLKNGVPDSAIVGENQSGHTRDNSFFSRKPCLSVKRFMPADA